MLCHALQRAEILILVKDKSGSNAFCVMTRHTIEGLKPLLDGEAVFAYILGEEKTKLKRYPVDIKYHFLA